jgi:hypothetical protein
MEKEQKMSLVQKKVDFQKITKISEKRGSMKCCKIPVKNLK